MNEPAEPSREWQAEPSAKPSAEPPAPEPAPDVPAEPPALEPATDVPAEPPEQTAPAATIADGRDHCLDPRSIPLERTVGWIVTGVLAAGSLLGLGIVFLAADDMPGWLRMLLPSLWAALMALAAWHTHRWPVLEHAHTSYRVNEQGIEIRKGVYWRVVVNLPRSRVQHTDVSQGPLERRYGLGTLVVYTAGTDHARVDLAGLEHGVALRIRGHLLPSGSHDAV